MLSNGVPAKDLLYKVMNIKRSGDTSEVMETFLEGARAEKLIIHDVSFFPRGDEVLAVFLFSLPKQ